jgi:hypothetical protein
VIWEIGEASEEEEWSAIGGALDTGEARETGEPLDDGVIGGVCPGECSLYSGELT